VRLPAGGPLKPSFGLSGHFLVTQVLGTLSYNKSIATINSKPAASAILARPSIYYSSQTRCVHHHRQHPHAMRESFQIVAAKRVPDSRGGQRLFDIFDSRAGLDKLLATKRGSNNKKRVANP
jgi:hypothetical protein